MFGQRLKCHFRRTTLSLVYSAASVAAAVVLGGAVSTASGAVTLTPLGDLPGGQFDSRATAVSADGSIVFGTTNTASGTQTFRWNVGTGMVSLGTLPGTTFSEPRSVSGDGSVLVGYSGNALPTAQFQAYRWTAGTGMVGLGVLPGDTFSSAAGVSGDGSVVVGVSRSDPSSPKAFRWISGSGMLALGTLPGDTTSEARGISADGSVIVGTSGDEAFRHTAGPGMVGLGTLPGDTTSRALGISADGSTIVGDSTSGLSEAFHWAAGTGMVGLGTLPFTNDSIATGVSGNGSVIVGTVFDEGDFAFIWTANSGMQYLDSVLAANGVNPAADGWIHLIVTGISADGNTVIGYGNRSGGFEAFIVTLPEPGGLSVTALGALALLRRRRRRHTQRERTGR
jgi:probable HAF family extracellular repeat protein